jgi:hypothetical protein
LGPAWFGPGRSRCFGADGGSHFARRGGWLRRDAGRGDAIGIAVAPGTHVGCIRCAYRLHFSADFAQIHRSASTAFAHASRLVWSR